jgi:hypothetical protein
MYIVALLHYTAFLVDIGIITFLLYKNFRSPLNRVCSFLIFTFAVWSFGYCCLNLSQNPQTAFLWMKIGAIGWIIFPAAALYFYLTLANDRYKLIRSKLLFVVLVASTVFFIYQVGAGSMIDGMIPSIYWWYGIWSDSVYSYLFFLYYAAISLVCIYLAYNYGRKAQTAREKMQSKIQLITSSISLTLASLVNVILPVSGICVLPQVADIIVMIWEIGIMLSVIKYGLMSVTRPPLLIKSLIP